MSFVVCYIHGTPFPRATSHQHHKIQQAAGGTDADLCWLCANCHTTVHQIATKLGTGKTGIAQDIASSYSPAPAMRQRLMAIAKVAAESMRDAAEGELPGRDEVMLQVALPKEIAQRFKLLVSDKRVNGRRVGVSRYLRGMIEKHLRDNHLL